MRHLLIALAVTLWSTTTIAQETPPPAAVLVADELFIANNRELIARGNVEALQGTTRLTAKEIAYDRDTGALVITGPIVLQDGEDITVLASAAELDATLRTGLLTSARMVLSQQLQLAAVQIQRVNGRYSQLSKTAATSCRVCNDGTPPLWQIRAKRVIHDKQERQLYFDGAQLLIRNIPVFYIPRLRLPDPTLKRATGFLFAELQQTSQFGPGIKIPYFINIAPDRDLTLTPYIARDSTTLELRYRQAFRKGNIELNGAISRDGQRPGETRGYFFADGNFALKNDFNLSFDIELATDDAYLSEYSISGKDRLDSAITISRVRRDEYISTGLTVYRSLRDDEDNSTLPTVVADGLYESRHFPSRLGGELRFRLDSNVHYRASDDDTLGRDVARISAETDWLRSWTLPGGLRADVQVGTTADLFQTRQDSTVGNTESQISPRGSVALRYPLSRTGQNDVTQLLEPIIQAAWVGGSRLDVVNEESTRVEFDGGNLTSLSRFPEVDRRERGRSLAVGMNWSRFNPEGVDTSLTFGRILRQDADDAFSESSGLSGVTSDYLVAGQAITQNGLIMTARSLFDADFDFTKSEIRGDYTGRRATLGGSYLWLVADDAEDRADSISEITLDGSYGIDRYWTASADWQYDLSLARASSVGLGLQYENECVAVALNFDRQFASSTSLEPNTTLGFTVTLRGFSAVKGTETYTKACDQ
ncbi:LPS assembly protein LptD [Roseobacter sp.]|uniref:LPS-assembly protein LptD n=1 Tax=Roseobacter sp. TaxID=1907202 RepID=UPI003299278B